MFTSPKCLSGIGHEQDLNCFGGNSSIWWCVSSRAGLPGAQGHADHLHQAFLCYVMDTESCHHPVRADLIWWPNPGNRNCYEAWKCRFVLCWSARKISIISDLVTSNENTLSKKLWFELLTWKQLLPGKVCTLVQPELWRETPVMKVFNRLSTSIYSTEIEAIEMFIPISSVLG